MHVKDLYTVLDSFRADYGVVVDDTNLPPVGANGVVLGQATKVHEFALLTDLSEGSTIVLPNGHELSTILRCPAPGGGAVTLSATQS